MTWIDAIDGYGILAASSFGNGEFIVNYRGVHSSDAETEIISPCVYMYEHEKKRFVVDATSPDFLAETPKGGAAYALLRQFFVVFLLI